MMDEKIFIKRATKILGRFQDAAEALGDLINESIEVINASSSKISPRHKAHLAFLQWIVNKRLQGYMDSLKESMGDPMKHLGVMLIDKLISEKEIQAILKSLDPESNVSFVHADAPSEELH